MSDPFRNAFSSMASLRSQIICENCRRNDHKNCRGKVVRTTVIRDLRDRTKDRTENSVLPCACYRCRVTAEESR